MAIAGFVAAEEVWVDWEREWIARLNRDNLTCFHRNELSHWPSSKRERLLEDLSTIILNHSPFRVGVAVINEDLTGGTTPQQQKEWHINGYSYAGRAASVEINEWRKSWGGKYPTMIFEDGDTGKGRLIDLFRRDKLPAPIFKPKRDRTHRKSGIVEKGIVPLQAADLYAYDIFSRARDIAKGKPLSRNFASGINPIIERLTGRCGIATVGHVQFMADGMQQRDALILQPSVKINTKDFIR
ncbi:MAG TPA: hypothetical protein VG273_04175 [Bryobacteraceae bacterium]|nr:hypothetical protein [Bryobacteraceae bacterium]